MNKLDLYLSAPITIQKAAINFEGYRILRRRYNRNFFGFLNEFLESNQQEVNYKDFDLFLKEAATIPFWRNKFKEYNIDIKATGENLLHELRKLPILKKEEVKNNVEAINNSRIKISDKQFLSTSGTTGSGLTFPQTSEMENKQWAVWWRYRKSHGISIDTWMGWFGGRSIAHINQVKPPFWRLNYPLKQIMFSAHHLNEFTVDYYHEEIKKRNLTWLHGYPSQLSLLANLIKNKNLPRLNSIKIITVGAENLLLSQKEIIEEVFEAPVRQHYGLAEGVANISENSKGELIPDQDFCFTEFIPVDPSNPEVCRIIGTNYNNIAFPLLRYDTGDIATIEKRSDGSVKVLSIDGRKEDFITLPNGVKLGRLDHIFKSLTEVKEAQIYQPYLDKIILRVVKGQNYEKANQEIKLLSEARKRFGKETQLEIEYLNQIPRTKSGKLRFVISEVK